MLQYIFSTTPILLSTYVSLCIDIMVSSAGVNMILAFLKKDIISGAKQLLWTGRVSDVQRRNKDIQGGFFDCSALKWQSARPIGKSDT